MKIVLHVLFIEEGSQPFKEVEITNHTYINCMEEDSSVKQDHFRNV